MVNKNHLIYLSWRPEFDIRNMQTIFHVDVQEIDLIDPRQGLTVTYVIFEMLVSECFY